MYESKAAIDMKQTGNKIRNAKTASRRFLAGSEKSMILQ